MNTRNPAVAGKFYPGNEKELNSLLDDIYKFEGQNIDTSYAQNNLIGGVVPHAGYQFSGYEAVYFFENLRKAPNNYSTFVIVYPNHNIAMEDMTVDGHTHWETPLGKVKVDVEFAKKLNLPISDEEGKEEHSGEVMVPFLQYFLDYPFQIVPIIMTNQNIQNAELLARLINNAQNETGRNIQIIASSDFSHFVAPETGQELDNLVIDQIKALNTIEVYEEIVRNDISVCGYGPIMTLMEYAKFVADNPQAEVLKKGNSAKMYPSSEVVDYVSMIVYGNS